MIKMLWPGMAISVGIAWTALALDVKGWNAALLWAALLLLVFGIVGYVEARVGGDHGD